MKYSDEQRIKLEDEDYILKSSVKTQTKLRLAAVNFCLLSWQI